MVAFSRVAIEKGYFWVRWRSNSFLARTQYTTSRLVVACGVVTVKSPRRLSVHHRNLSIHPPNGIWAPILLYHRPFVLLRMQRATDSLVVGYVVSCSNLQPKSRHWRDRIVTTRLLFPSMRAAKGNTNIIITISVAGVCCNDWGGVVSLEWIG